MFFLFMYSFLIYIFFSYLSNLLNLETQEGNTLRFFLMMLESACLKKDQRKTYKYKQTCNVFS